MKMNWGHTELEKMFNMVLDDFIETCPACTNSKFEWNVQADIYTIFDRIAVIFGY